MYPPEEMQKLMGLREGEIVRLVKGAYGRVDAPYLWYVELRKQLEGLGMKVAPFDPCCFILPSETSIEGCAKIDGILGIHVDDGLAAGNHRFEKILNQLQEIFPFGSRKQKEFVFTGLHLKQHDDGEITVDQTSYIKGINPIEVTKDRRKEPNQKVTEKEKQELRALIGSLQYAAVNSRPDLCSSLSWLQSQINKATIATLLEGNRVLHEAKMFSETKLRIQPIARNKMRFLAFTDASFRKIPRCSTGYDDCFDRRENF